MSSIYRKGRDGYFYYQAYIFNDETGKKDKKIFHSLGTKDQNLAKQKQVDLDKRYNEKIFKNEPSFKIKRYLRKSPFSLFFVFLEQFFLLLIS